MPLTQQCPCRRDDDVAVGLGLSYLNRVRGQDAARKTSAIITGLSRSHGLDCNPVVFAAAVGDSRGGLQGGGASMSMAAMEVH